MNWVVGIAGAVIGALITSYILGMIGVTGILYTVLVLVGSAACSSLAGTIYIKMKNDRSSGF
ncbi:glycerol dehydrogenase [Corynebacterium aquatimens]|uniref:Glycerol dehydrogenase n=1 Tax=Corynebacterium aquatimens TaxID=1190508 RepID=A0A931GWW0_9CORY|nr:glycerol dehydrogenase [Corynebacterium aquatimens]MBG6123241.1 hypothetical protein [Corynebacterium aquatimens]WJY66430.1 hypothetical protein CAQUA_08710 [Corynebacterium aquatimens]